MAEQHCTFNVNTGDAQCFATFQEAIAHATGGRVADAPNDVRAAMADTTLTDELNSDGVGPQAVVIGIEFLFVGFGTPSLTFSGSVPCTSTLADVDYRAAMLPIPWKNNIRSFQAFNGCWQRMWENPNCTGLLLDYAPSSSSITVGTECIEWS